MDRNKIKKPVNRWKVRTDRKAFIIWLILKNLVDDVTVSKKRIYKKDVYHENYIDNTKQRKPRANTIKEALMTTTDPDIKNIELAIDELLKEGKKNNMIADEIYRNQNNLVRNIMNRDGFGSRIFTEQLFRAYEGDNIIEEVKREKKEREKKEQKAKPTPDDESGDGFSSGDDVTLTDRQRREMKRQMDMKMSKIKTTQASELSKAKIFIPTTVKNKILNELGLDSKEKKKKQAVNNALQLINDTEDMTLNERARYLNVLLGYVTTYNVGQTIRESIEALIVNNYRQIRTEAEERTKQNIELQEQKEREEKKKQDEIRKEQEERLKKSRAEYEKEQFKQVDTEPRLTFADVTLRESEWKLLLNIASNTVDNTLTANQKRLNRMRLNDKLKQYAERNNTNTPSVQSGLMEYKESLEPREPGKMEQKVFRPDSNVKTTTQFGFVAQSMGMLSNQLQDVKQEVSNASIKSQENFEKASEERYILYESLMEANNDIERTIQMLRDTTQLPVSYLNAVEEKIKKKLPERKETKDFLSPSQIGIVLQSIPETYRNTLSPMVQTLLSGTTDLNNIVMGLVGLGMISSGFTFGGEALRIAGGYLLNAYNIDLNDYLYTRNVDAPPPVTVLPPNTNTSAVFEERRKMLSREEVLRRTAERKGREKQTEDIRNLMIQTEDEIVDPNNVVVGNLSDSDREYIETKAKTLTDNVIDDLGGVSKDDAQILRENARRYISEQISRLRYGITEQLFRPSEVADAMDELDNSLGFFDYLRNIGGLPSALMANIPRIPLSELRNALPTLTEIKSNIPIPFIRGAKPDLIEVLGPDGKPTDDRKSMKDRKFLPSRDELKEGAIGGVQGAIVPAAVRGGPMGAVGSLGTGAVGGAAIASITSPMIRRYYEQQGYDMNDPLIKSYVNKITALPPLVAGAIIGAYGLGEGVFSGAGVTERKITVDPSVLAETKGVDQQEGKDPKKWATKAIMPTPDILDETRQEKFVSDLEFSMFNYVEPGSEGANGNIKTNPLKRSQFLTDQIRYMDAGISTPSMLYNVEFPTNSSQKQMETYKLGQTMLPEMEFLVDDNADTFTPIGRYYPNNNDTAIEYLSPFANYSDVRNYWAINRKSHLYNLYA